MEFLAAHPDCKVMFHHPYVDLIFSSLFLVLLDVLLTLLLLLFQTNLSTG
jgi:hypothetical protein